jgi:hypothetical protein
MYREAGTNASVNAASPPRGRLENALSVHLDVWRVGYRLVAAA